MSSANFLQVLPMHPKTNFQHGTITATTCFELRLARSSNFSKCICLVYPCLHDGACQETLVVFNHAEDFLLTGTKSFARLSLSGRVKPVTDPNFKTICCSIPIFNRYMTCQLAYNPHQYIFLKNILILRVPKIAIWTCGYIFTLKDNKSNPNPLSLFCLPKNIRILKIKYLK